MIIYNEKEAYETDEEYILRLDQEGEYIEIPSTVGDELYYKEIYLNEK